MAPPLLLIVAPWTRVLRVVRLGIRRAVARSGYRGRAAAVLLAPPYTTAPRVSETTARRVRNVLWDRQTAVHRHGKGRKERVIPLWKNTATGLRDWLGKINVLSVTLADDV